MKKLFKTADIYLSRCKWQDMALLKFCLCALGIIIGMSVPKKSRKYFWLFTPIIFVITLIPLLTKLYQAFLDVESDV